MRSFVRVTVAALAAGAVSHASHAQGRPSPAQPTPAPAARSGGPALSYPQARRGDQTDVYHGVRVADPYRWLEDTDSPETKAWVVAENRVTESYLSSIPQRSALRARLTTLWDYPKYGALFREGGKYFSFENTGLQSQSVLWVRDKLDAPARVLLDPNTLSSDGTVAVGTLAVSPNGRLLGYGTSASGSDWQEIHVRDVAGARDLADTLRWVKFSGIAWTRDNKGFFYSRYPKPDSASAMTGSNRSQQLYYHRVGQSQASDRLIYERSDGGTNWLIGAEVSHDGQFAVISARQGADKGNRIYFIDLDNPKSPRVTAPVVRLIDTPDVQYSFVDNAGPVFYLRTDDEAPRGRVVAVSTVGPRADTWRTVIAEGPDAMTDVVAAGESFVVSYLQDAHAKVSVYDRGGAPKGDVTLPGLGSVNALSGQPDDNEVFFTYTTYLAPAAVYRYDLKHRSADVVRQAKLPVDASAYETRQLFYSGKDGTRVPMFVTAKKGVALDGNNPTLLYAYGGFNIPETPAFSPATLAWLEMGGVYAVANIRGGGEYGKEWHEAGTLLRKQNVFDDFIAAAEYLVKNGYTRPAKLAVEGASNGGLLIGAAITQRPDLFGAALPAVGVMDMLRYHKFTIGWAWAPDYGTSDDSTQFQALYRYSPLHNLKPGTKYPPTLVTTADHDDRVVPGHSFKFAATLQAAQAGTAPVLIRIDSKAGHGGGKPTAKRIEELADEYAFLVRALGVQGTLQ